MAFEGGISRRKVVTGAMGVGAASVMGVAIARAQTSTPGAATSTPASGMTATGSTPKRYTDFVDKLAVNLGNLDPTKVDAAIRTTLKQMVDDALKAGNISAKEATALKNRIDSGNFPADLPIFGLRGRIEKGAMRRRRLEGGGKGKDNENNENKGTKPSNNGTPAATPSTT